MKSLPRILTLSLVLLAACVGDHAQPIDPLAGYVALGESIEPAEAVPVSLLDSEGDELVGKTVKLEGRISEVCQGAGCWLTLQAVDGPLVRIDVPRDENGAYVYTFPKDASGRRAIVAGTLEADRAHEHMGHEGDDHGHMVEGHDERETAVLNESAFSLIATGALLERVGT